MMKTVNERVSEYIDDLNDLLVDRLSECTFDSLLAMAESEGLTFKDTLDKCKSFSKQFCKAEYDELQVSILMAFVDATESYWYSRLSDLGILDEQIETWKGDSLDIDYGIDIKQYDYPLIISRFKGIAFTRVYMDLSVELLNNLDELEDALDEEIKTIIEVQKLDIEISC